MKCQSRSLWWIVVRLKHGYGLQQADGDFRLSSWTVIIFTDFYNSYLVGLEANSHCKFKLQIHVQLPLPTTKMNIPSTLCLLPCSLERRGEKSRKRSQENIEVSTKQIQLESRWVSQVVLVVKNLPANADRCERLGFNPWVWKIPWRRAQQPTPVFLLEESHGQRSPAGCSPWGCPELDTTEVTQHTCM